MAAKDNRKDEPGGTSMNKFFSGSRTEDERGKQYDRDKKKKSKADIQAMNKLRFGGLTEDEAGKQAKAFFDAKRNKKSYSRSGGPTEDEMGKQAKAFFDAKRNKKAARMAAVKKMMNEKSIR